MIEVEAKPRFRKRSMLRAVGLEIVISLFIPLSASTLEPARIVRLPFGESPSCLGGDFNGGESWYPLLFAMADDGTLHVPDFYKNRIAIFDAAGRYSREIPVVEGISPRLAYFTAASDESYLVYDDGALHLIDAEGNTLRRFTFPLGSVPVGAVMTDAGFFVAMPDRGGGDVAYRFADDLAVRPDTVFDEAFSAKRAAAFDGRGLRVNFDLRTTLRLHPESVSDLQALPSGTFFLVAIHEGGTCLWFNGKDRLIATNAKSALFRSIRLEGLDPARGFSWIHSPDAETVAVSRFSADALAIAVYRIEK